MNTVVDITSIWQPAVSKKSFLSFLKKKSGPFLHTPTIIKNKCNGLLLEGLTVRSLFFSTDVALIENNDCDAILAVYPFSPSAKIMGSLIQFTHKPVICGIGGGLTQGKVAMNMALQAEQLGASAVIVNQPFQNKWIEVIRKKIRIPIISSVSHINFQFRERASAGVDIFHITGGKNTGCILEHLKAQLPGYPLMATGGKSLSCIEQSIVLGADAIVLTPPATGELFRKIMDGYRKGLGYLR
ncbi:MAG: hypothetical protein ACTHK8_01915 [Ginsengibacter sp.]